MIYEIYEIKVRIINWIKFQKILLELLKDIRIKSQNLYKVRISKNDKIKTCHNSNNKIRVNL